MSETSSLAILDIERHLDAPREAVFSALTSPEKMNQWFCGIPGGHAKVEQDFRVGGTYRAKMFRADGTVGDCGGGEGDADHAPYGEYLEIDPPKKLVFTWNSHGFVEGTTVTILLEESGQGTKLTLRHELPASMVDCHRQGWTTCMDHLETLFTGK